MDLGGGDIRQTQHHIGRIPRNAAKGSVISLYILAVIAAGFRTTIRLRCNKLQWLDDGFISLAILFMTVSFGVFLGFLNDVYKVESLIYDPYSASNSLSDLIVVAKRVQLYTVVYIITSISGIFAVKFSFLFFFRNILSRIRPLVIYWRCIATFTAIAWAFSIGFSVYGCPYVDERALSCAQGPTLYMAIDTSVGLIVFDICSDLLIISVPVLVLKRVRLPWKKKLYLGCSLCLSAILIVVAVLQAATLTYMGVPAIDVVWEIYFQFVELTLAVIVVSATAFQIFFIQRAQQDSNSSLLCMPKCSWCKQEKYKKAWSKVWPSANTEESHAPQLNPQIPRAELTGIGSAIDRAAASPSLDGGGGGSEQAHELREIRPSKRARVEPVGTIMSMIDPVKEYNNLQRELHTMLSPSKTLHSHAQSNMGVVEAGEDSSAHLAMPFSSFDSSSETVKPKISPSVFATRDQRLNISPPLEKTQPQPQLGQPGKYSVPQAGVSPLEPHPHLINFSQPSQFFSELSRRQLSSTESKSSSDPSSSQLRRPIISSRPTYLPVFQDDDPLPSALSVDPAARIEHFLASSNSPQKSLRERSIVMSPSEPSMARRPRRQGREELLLQESGLESATQNSLELASDGRPRVNEGWFLDAR